MQGSRCDKDFWEGFSHRGGEEWDAGPLTVGGDREEKKRVSVRLAFTRLTVLSVSVGSASREAGEEEEEEGRGTRRSWGTCQVFILGMRATTICSPGEHGATSNDHGSKPGSFGGGDTDGRHLATFLSGGVEGAFAGKVRGTNGEMTAARGYLRPTRCDAVPGRPARP